MHNQRMQMTPPINYNWKASLPLEDKKLLEQAWQNYRSCSMRI
jgi:hypothetical protein